MKWVAPENLHLSLKFIGEQPQPEPICMALADVSFGPIEIRLCGLGWFPRVFWVGVEAPDTLARLAKNIEESLVPLGIARETRPFSPHLTLARVKQPVPHPTKDPHRDFGAFLARDFVLYQSHLSPAGASYTPLRRFSSA
jgi:2'-5' RNA ligase